MAHFLRSSFSRATSSKLAFQCRNKSSQFAFKPRSNKVVLLGLHQEEGEEGQFSFSSPGGQDYCTPHLLERLVSSGPAVKKGQARVLHGQEDLVVVVGLGKDCSKQSESEDRNENKESIRAAVAAGVKAVKDYGVQDVLVDGCGDEEAAAEGAHLATWAYDELKEKKDPLSKLNIKPLDDKDNEVWRTGMQKAKGQNLARTLMETPANKMTPTEFAKRAKNELGCLGVDVIARDSRWIHDQKMGSFLSVSKGSRQEPVFLEMNYNGSTASNPEEEQPVIFVGKGVTFDTGGISIKPSKGMDRMRGDMGGAATVTGSLYVAASLKLPINLKVLIPLCENMPDGQATKPGDVVVARNGKTIQVDNTDAEGRLILADALCYANDFRPKLVMDVATLTGAMAVALGGGAAGVFTNSAQYWNMLHASAFHTGDRVWRMPLFSYYKDQITKSQLADLNNISSKPYGGSCTAAAFLKEFVTCDNWMHVDIAGVMDNQGDVPYLSNGMSGRPTRTFAEFLSRLSHS